MKTKSGQLFKILLIALPIVLVCVPILRVVVADTEREIKSNLARESARIVAETGRASERFQFDYVAGKGKGTVAVDPIVIVDHKLVDPSELPLGEVAVELRVRITETWYKASEKACSKL